MCVAVRIRLEWGGGGAKTNSGMTTSLEFSGKCLCLVMEEAADLGYSVSITKGQSL